MYFTTLYFTTLIALAVSATSSGIASSLSPSATAGSSEQAKHARLASYAQGSTFEHPKAGDPTGHVFASWTPVQDRTQLEMVYLGANVGTATMDAGVGEYNFTGKPGAAGGNATGFYLVLATATGCSSLEHCIYAVLDVFTYADGALSTTPTPPVSNETAGQAAYEALKANSSLEIKYPKTGDYWVAGTTNGIELGEHANATRYDLYSVGNYHLALESVDVEKGNSTANVSFALPSKPTVVAGYLASGAAFYVAVSKCANDTCHAPDVVGVTDLFEIKGVGTTPQRVFADPSGATSAAGRVGVSVAVVVISLALCIF